MAETQEIQGLQVIQGGATRELDTAIHELREPQNRKDIYSAPEIAELTDTNLRTLQNQLRSVIAAYSWLSDLKIGNGKNTRYSAEILPLLRELQSRPAGQSEQDWIDSIHAAHPEHQIPATQESQEIEQPEGARAQIIVRPPSSATLDSPKLPEKVDLIAFGVGATQHFDDPITLANQAIAAIDQIDSALDEHLESLKQRRDRTREASQQLREKRKALESKALKSELRSEIIQSEISRDEASLESDINSLKKPLSDTPESAS